MCPSWLPEGYDLGGTIPNGGSGVVASDPYTSYYILVAVKKEKINDYTSVISQTGKVPVLVDVDAFALQNAYEMNYAIDDGKVLALVNVGASVTNVNVLSGATSLFWRDITFGGNQYTDAIQRELSLSFEQAEELKKGQPVGDYTHPAGHPHPQLRHAKTSRASCARRSTSSPRRRAPTASTRSFSPAAARAC